MGKHSINEGQRLSDHVQPQRYGMPRRSARRRRLPIDVRSDMYTQSQGTSLCRRCQEIDLDRVFSKKHLTRNGNLVCRLGPIDKWKIDSCPLCQLFMRTFGISRRTQNELRSFSTKRILHRGLKSVDMDMLSIDWSSRFLVSLPKGGEIIRIIEPLVSFELIKEWLSFCRNHHSRSCIPSENSVPVSSIRFFKLIDCETRRIVSVTDQPYTTLSYVWGPVSATAFSEFLPTDLPKTIQDAITVTRELGFRYLWIDRFCINQQVQAEIDEQVPKMDLIYNNSELNIIAAAGEDPSYGLPGIQSRNPSQPCAQLGDYFLVSTLVDPTHSIQTSKWMSRAWTYQEGVLSRRRLIFTDEQVYFECSSMYACEVLNLPLSNLHTHNGQHFKSCFCSGTNTNIFPRNLGRTGWEVVERIQEYSRRSLTNGSDILSGFMGILRAMERGPQRIRHYFGVPIIPKAPKPRSLLDYDTSIIQEAYDSFKWSPTAGFCFGLCWDTEQPSARREGFPSWSWAGWYGNIKWCFGEWFWKRLWSNVEIQVRVQLEDGKVLPLDEFEREYKDRHPNMSSILHVSAWITPLQRSTRYRSTMSVIAKATDGCPLNWCFNLTEEYQTIPPTKWMAVHLAHDFEKSNGLVLVIREIRPGLYQRCGVQHLMSACSFHYPGKYSDTRSGYFYGLKDMGRSWQEFCLC